MRLVGLLALLALAGCAARPSPSTDPRWVPLPAPMPQPAPPPPPGYRWQAVRPDGALLVADRENPR